MAANERLLLAKGDASIRRAPVVLPEGQADVAAGILSEAAKEIRAGRK